MFIFFSYTTTSCIFVNLLTRAFTHFRTLSAGIRHVTFYLFKVYIIDYSNFLRVFIVYFFIVCHRPSFVSNRCLNNVDICTTFSGSLNISIN